MVDFIALQSNRIDAVALEATATTSTVMVILDVDECYGISGLAL